MSALPGCLPLGSHQESQWRLFRLGPAYKAIPMRMNSIAFVSFMAVAMIASAAEAGKHRGIKTD
jgi:hypothetical protein